MFFIQKQSMVNSVINPALTQPCSPGAVPGRLKKILLSVAGILVISALIAGAVMLPLSPPDLAVGKRLISSGMLADWRAGNLIVVVRHAERCDRSTNPCLGPPDGLTIVGTEAATALGNAFKTLGMEQTDILSSPATRTAQTALFMFGKANLATESLGACTKTLSEQVVEQKVAGRNLILVTHSGCIADFESELGFPHAAGAEYASSFIVSVTPNGSLKVVGIMNAQDWPKALKQL